MGEYTARLACVGRTMGLEATIRYQAKDDQDAKDQAETYVACNREYYSRVIKVARVV